jgi:predicted Zn-dependent protease
VENSKRSAFTKIVVLGSGMAFLAGSVLGIGGMISSSLDRPAANEQAAQSQNAQLQAEEKGFAAVLQREPNNQTALKGLVSIKMRQGDVPGTKAALERLVKLNPANTQYKDLLDAINKQMAEAKNVGTLKPTEPTQPSKPSK